MEEITLYTLYQLYLKLEKQVANLLKKGRVHSVDHGNYRCRVMVDDRLSGWLRWVTPRAANTSEWDPPQKGEQVYILSPDGNPAQAFVLPASFCDAFPPPSTNPSVHRKRYPDGMVVDHDHSKNLTRISAIDNGGTLVLEAKNVIIRTGEEGYYQLDLAGYASRTTHVGGPLFEAESWHVGAMLESIPDYGFSPHSVDSPGEG